MSTATVEQVFESQRNHRWTMSKTTAKQRISRLLRFRAEVVARREQIADAVRADFGKARAEVEITEINPLLEEIDHICKELPSWMTREKKRTPLILAGTKSYVQFEPRGVVLILAPWNYPFNLLMTPFVAAIAAGNCVMMRPSDKTAHTGEVMRKLIADAFPPEEAMLFTGGTSVADALLELPFDHIFFTGSPRIGRKIAEKAAKHLASVTLELGGKSPAIVDAEADVAQAAQRIAWGKFVNAGQTCVAPDHVWVHRTVAPRFVEETKKAITRMYGATDEDRRKSPDFARVIDLNSLTRLNTLVRESVASGATLECGGQTDDAERYLAPTVLSNVTVDMPVMREELFGPVMPVLAFHSLDDVIGSVNRQGKPLAMYLFGSGETVNRMLHETSAGGTVIGNTLIHLANPHLPFGGAGESGQGNYHGHYGFRTFSHERAVLVQGRASLAPFFYPPYGERSKEIARSVVRRRLQ